ncbi:MAG: DegV family protein [Chloroflexota bacterium]|nr:DegV family protein [Chloroflexota bacterium]
MSQVQLITDGTAFLPPERLRELGVISLPIVAQVGQKTYIYDQQVKGHVELLSDLVAQRQEVQIIGPSPDDFRAVFARTLYRTNKMLLILSSGQLSPVLENARLGAQDFMGRCDILILDSETISMGLGVLVERAGILLQEDVLPLSAIVRQLRGMMPHLYVAMISHTLEYLQRSGRLSAMQAILGSFLGIHPFMEIERGDIMPLEKSRSASKALDRLDEFVSEFSNIRELVILKGAGPEIAAEAAELRAELEEILPGINFSTIHYDPILASHVGPSGLGLVVYEGSRAR